MNERAYEFWLIDNIKAWSDKIRTMSDKEDRLMELNIYEELLNCLVKYRNLSYDVDMLPEVEDMDLIPGVQEAL